MIFRHFLPLLLIVFSVSANAKLRWFDIELIIFERESNTELKEDIAAHNFEPIDYTGTQDLIAEAMEEVSKFEYNSCLGITPENEQLELVDATTRRGIDTYSKPEALPDVNSTLR